MSIPLAADSPFRKFYTESYDFNPDDYITLEYYFETDGNPYETAAHLAQEQSTAQWRRVGVDEDLRDRFGAKVIELKVEAELESPSCCLPQDAVHIQAQVTDEAATITVVTLSWGFSATSLPNQIPMQKFYQDFYLTQTQIPAQPEGSTIYYRISAANDVSAADAIKKWPCGFTDKLVEQAYCLLYHFRDDEDIRSKDRKYAEFQHNEFRSIVRELRHI